MGFAISWCGVPESAADGFLQRVGLVETGATEEVPDALIGVARLDTRWRVLWYNKYDCLFLTEDDRRSHSRHHELLYCLVEEHCMASSAELWTGGERKWFISHEGVDGPKGLSFCGTLPEDFRSIKAEMEARQLKTGGDRADVDYMFEIPLLMAKKIVGFKHDEVCPHVIGNEFRIMTKREPSGGFLSRILGRK